MSALSSGMKNPKTTIIAICAAVAAIAGAVTAITDGDPATNPDWAILAAVIATAIGLLFARDADKTSAQSGAGK